MNEHIVKSFDEQLGMLAHTVVQMGALVAVELAQALEAIAKRDSGRAEEAIGSDQRVDDLHQAVDEQALRVLALRQPMAVDLRSTLAATRIAHELERIGDLAKNIAKRALVLSREPPIRLTQSLAIMGRESLSQLETVLSAYADHNADVARSVWRRDEEIDELYNSLFRELLTYMMEDTRTIGLCTHLLFVAKNIERAGDHATNIAETVHHMITGAYLRDERPKADVTATTPIAH